MATVIALRRVLAGGAALAAGVVAVVGIELRLAGIWPRLADPEFDLDGPAGASGAGRRLRVFWLGDSAVAGVGASDRTRTLVHRVAAGVGRPMEVRVLAESGVTTAEAVKLAARAADFAPDVVFVSVGANDASHLHTRRRFGRRYRELVRALPPGVPLVLLGVPDMGGAIPRWLQPLRAFSEWRGFRLDAELRRIAQEVGALYVNIAGRTGRDFRRRRDRLYAADCYHPGDAGYAAWARAVLDRLGETGFLGSEPAVATATGPDPAK